MFLILMLCGNILADSKNKDVELNQLFEQLKKRTLKWFRSSKRAKRGFCRKCGASLFFKFIDSNNISIAAGMFNGPTKLKTKMNIFVKGKLDYYELDNRLPKFKRYPK